MTRTHKASHHITTAATLRIEAKRMERWGFLVYAEQLRRAAQLEMDKAHRAMGLMA